MASTVFTVAENMSGTAAETDSDGTECKTQLLSKCVAK